MFPDDKDFNKSFKRFTGLIVGVWIVASAASIGLTVAIIWGIVKVVQHFT